MQFFLSLVNNLNYFYKFLTALVSLPKGSALCLDDIKLESKQMCIWQTRMFGLENKAVTIEVFFCTGIHGLKICQAV